MSPKTKKPVGFRTTVALSKKDFAWVEKALKALEAHELRAICQSEGRTPTPEEILPYTDVIVEIMGNRKVDPGYASPELVVNMFWEVPRFLRRKILDQTPERLKGKEIGQKKP